MQKSQMMMLVVVMAICCFSCISSVTMVAGIGNSLGPLNDRLNSQQGGLGNSLGPLNDLLNSQQGGLELKTKECKRCQENNWEGTTIEGGGIQCSEYKGNCIFEDAVIKSCRKCRENNWEGTITNTEGKPVECNNNKAKDVCVAIEESFKNL